MYIYIYIYTYIYGLAYFPPSTIIPGGKSLQIPKTETDQGEPRTIERGSQMTSQRSSRKTEEMTESRN